MTASWLKSIVESPDRLGSIVTYANWGIVATLVLGAFLTAFVIWAGSHRERLLKDAELAKDTKIADANRVAAQANERAGLANERAAKLELESAGLKRDAERDRLARVEIEERLADRQIAPKQAAALSAEARKLADVKVRFLPSAGNPEALRYAGMLSQLFRESKVNAAVISGSMNQRPGIIVLTRRDEPSMTESGNRVHAALVAAGFNAERFIDPTQFSMTGLVSVLVGPKPVTATAK